MKDFIKRMMTLSSKPIKYERPPTYGPTAPKTYYVPDRGVSVREDTINNLVKPILFGEMSNRELPKQIEEGKTIINTAINRVSQYGERGKDMNLAGVLSAPNQYQAYGGKEYERYLQGSTTPVDAQKMKAVDEIVAQLKAGKLKDNTGNRVFYIHTDDGNIITREGPLFK